MKKMLICCATLCVTLTLFCVAALATDLKAAVEPVDAQTVNVVEKQGGADRVFTVTKDSGVKAGDLYLVLIEKGLKAGDKPKPTAEDIYYIDVWEATDSGLNRDATPRDMDAGSYAVFLSDWSDSGKGAAKGVATITLSAPTSDPGDSTTPGSGSSAAKRGNVDGVGDVDLNDAIYILKYLANTEGYSVQGKEDIANVDGIGVVDINDAIYILKYLANMDGYSLSD